MDPPSLTPEAANVALDDPSPASTTIVEPGSDSSPSDSEMKRSASHANEPSDSDPHEESSNKDHSTAQDGTIQAPEAGTGNDATITDVIAESNISRDPTADLKSDSLDQDQSPLGPDDQQIATVDDKQLNQESTLEEDRPSELPPGVTADGSTSLVMRMEDNNSSPSAEQDSPASLVPNPDPIDAVAPTESPSLQLADVEGEAHQASLASPAADCVNAPQNHLESESQQPFSEAIQADRPDQILSEEEVAVRDACVTRIKSALLAQEAMRAVSVSLQHKLSDLFRKRRAEDKNNEPDKSVTDQDQRFANVMTSLKQLRSEYEKMERTQLQVDQEFKAKLQDRKQEFSERSEEFRKYRRQIAVSSENSRTGKSIPLKIVEQLEAQDSRKEAEVAAVRLENIKLRNKLKRHEQTLRQKEELAEGLHLIDFEQLKIENQTYNEKIEERNEELMKLRKKITNVVQVLAHIKEKLQFVQEENSCLSDDLSAIDVQVGKERDQLPVAKQQRDQLRSRNNFLKEKNGLLGNNALLRDFELRVDEVQALKSELTQLQELYSQLTRTIKVQQAQTYNQAVLPLILN